MGSVDMSRQEAWAMLQSGAEHKRLEQVRVSTSDDGFPTFESMSTITREEMDAKFSLSEARVEKSLAEMKAEIVGMRGDFSTAFASVPSRGFVVVTALAIVAAVIGAMALGYTQFGNGVMVTSVAVQDAQEAKRLAQENANAVEAMRTELSTFISDFKQTPAWNSAPHKQ